MAESGTLSHSEIEEETDISPIPHLYLGAGKSWGRSPMVGQLENIRTPGGLGA